MANIYEQTIAKARKIILNTSNKDLSYEGYSIKLFNSSRINIPKIVLEKTKVQIKEEEISFRNAPPGISFSISGNKKIEYALYSFPIEGDKELFASLIRHLIDRRMTYIDNNNLYYKEYSDIQISGNDELIKQIRERVKAFTINVITSLKQFEDEVIKFHDTKLKPIIEELIKSEIGQRNLTSDSESKLNPFA